MNKKIKIIIQGALPDLNQYIKAMNSHYIVGNRMKRESMDRVIQEAKIYHPRHLGPVEIPCFIEFHWYCKDRKKDKDNISAGKKFILDGLQEAGVLPQDNWNAITGFSDFFYLDRDNPRIEIIIKN